MKMKMKRPIIYHEITKEMTIFKKLTGSSQAMFNRTFPNVVFKLMKDV